MPGDSDEKRPTNRADCRGGPRPCPWVSCRFNLSIEVTAIGTIKVAGDQLANLPVRVGYGIERHVERIATLVALHPGPTNCALDIADEGPANVDEVAEVLQCSHQNVSQIEKPARESFESEWSRRYDRPEKT